MLTARQLKVEIEYNPETGLFKWKIGRQGRKKTWFAGAPQTDGYRQICINGVCYLSHRLAWLYVYGALPKKPLVLDHINQVKIDNRIANLRIATISDNAHNTSTYSKNKSGVRGVFFEAGKWRVQVTIKGKRVNPGYFDSIEAAKKAYLLAKPRVSPSKIN